MGEGDAMPPAVVVSFPFDPSGKPETPPNHAIRQPPGRPAPGPGGSANRWT
jgi:hypothetical protein